MLSSLSSSFRSGASPTNQLQLQSQSQSQNRQTQGGMYPPLYASPIQGQLQPYGTTGGGAAVYGAVQPYSPGAGAGAGAGLGQTPVGGFGQTSSSMGMGYPGQVQPFPAAGTGTGTAAQSPYSAGPGAQSQLAPLGQAPYQSLSHSQSQYQHQVQPYPFPASQCHLQQQSQAVSSQQQQQQLQQAGTSSNPVASNPSYRPYYSQPSTALGPQPLESVAKDEDPVYGPLGRARGKVERGLKGDEEISPDLGDLVGVANNEPYAPLPSQAASFRPLRITRTTPLPDALHQELNYKHLSAKMGLFEEIDRAWFTVDNKLFLWNYNDGREFSRYDEQNDTIVAVGLVRARRDVFVDDITYVLIICTAAKATLLGLTRTSSDINLYHTNLQVDLPTPMITISGTNAGRIFMNGANKELFELEYSSESGWFFGSSTKIGLKNLSSGSLSNWVPSVFGSSNKEGVENFVVDALQAKVYTLHTKGEIELFDVSGNNYISRGKYARVRSDLIQRGLGGAPPQHSQARVVALAVIGPHESRRTGLVAITANGTRIYFSASSPFYPIAFRPPPSSSFNLASQTLYSSGTLLGVQHDSSGPQPVTQLHSVIPNPGRQSSARENYDNFEAPVLQEWSVSDIIPSQVWTVVELPATNPSTSSSSLRRSDGLALSALPRQVTAEARQYLILATSGLFWAEQTRPIDMLQSNLEQEKDTAIAIVRNTFGRTQLAAMGITIGCQSDLKQAEIASAVSAILLSGGAPAIRDGTAGRSIVYSPRHDGFAITLGRLLRPLWNVKVTLLGMGGRQFLSLPDTQLLSVQGRLEQLRRYVDEHPFPRHQAEGDAKLAWDQEELSLHGLNVLLKQAIEAISFVLLLSDYKITDVVARCDPGLQQTLSSLTYQGLFASVDGREVARKLVTALIEQQIGQELGIDTLSEILQQRCGTFCQPGDVVLYKAEENMRRAESSRDPVERNESLSESLRLFTKAASSLPVSRLQDVSQRYRVQQYTVGAIELPLKCAAELDPNDKALDYVRDGRHPADPRKALYESRLECYSCVTQALGMFDEMLDKATASGNAGSATSKRDEAYSLAINSDDELFHFYLYDWHVDRGLQEQLLEFDTPFIEGYLRLASLEDEKRDLLWKFYARREDYLPAAKALHDLATRPTPMSLNDRMYYLAQALTSAKSAATFGAEDVEFTSSLQERIDVASVQAEVERAIEMHGEMGEDEKKEALGRIDGELVGLDELYQSYARPLRLYEPILLILKTADTRIEDVCEAVWRQLLNEPIGTGEAYAVVGEKVRVLLGRYFPSEAAPSDIVLPVVYDQAAKISAVSPTGWATEAVLAGGVGLRDVWEAVAELYERSGEEREFLEEEAGVIFTKWLTERDAIPAAEVERFASNYLLRVGGGGAVEGRKAETKERMTAAKNAAVRF